MAVELSLEIVTKFEKAIKDFEAFTAKAQKNTEKVGKGFENLDSLTKKFIGAFTVKKIIDGLEAIADKASESEQATFRLGRALAGTGNNTDNNIRLFQDLAKELERTSRFDDELILSSVGVAKQFGVTNKEAEKLIRTAVDLSGQMGVDLETAVRALGQTLDGTAGRLSQQFPILQSLTAAQLRHGAAIKILGDQYRGTAAQGVKTFAGQANQLSKSFGNLQEALGTLIITNPRVIQSIADMTVSLQKLTEWVERNGQRIVDFTEKLILLYKLGFAVATKNGRLLVDTFKQISGASEKTAESVDVFNGSMNNLVSKFNPITGKFESLVTGAKNGSKALRDAAGSFNYLTGKFSKGFDESGKEFNRFANEAKDKFETLQKSLEDVGRTELDTLTNLYNKNRTLINRAADLSFINRQSQTELLGRLELKFVRESGELRKKQYQELESKVREAFDNPFKAFGDRYNTGRISEEAQTQVAGGLGFARESLRGQEGARNVLSQGIGAIASVWLGPLGKIIADLVAELSKGPEFVKQMMGDFFDAIPDLVVNLIAAVQEAVLVFIDKAPEALQRLLERTPEIIDNIIKNLPKLFFALPRYVVAFARAVAVGVIHAVEGIGKLINRYFNDVIKGAARFISELVKGAGKIVDAIVKGVGKAFNVGGKNGVFSGKHDWGNQLTGGWSTIGSGNPDWGSIASGGLTNAIGIKFKGGGGPQPVVVNMQIGNKTLATAMLDLQKLGFMPT